MIIHTFAFRWKPGATEAQKAEAVRSIQAFQGQIPGLLATYVGDNFSPRSEGYELGGVMHFPDRAALDAYTAHPAHQTLLRWLQPLISPLEVDFEV
jgi:hypothetical protein